MDINNIPHEKLQFAEGGLQLHDQKFEMRKKISDLEIAYYKKYKAILTPRHIQQLFDLEYKFKKSLTTKNKGEKKEVPANISGSKKKR